MNLEERVLSLQRSRGDASLLIEEYMPFIASCASKQVGKRIGPQQDELSIAMSAFHEAIQTFDKKKGTFLPFASLVVRHRLIDFARGSGAAKEEIPFSSLSSGSDQEQEPFEVADSSQQDRRDITQEIEALSAELRAFGISFDDLADASPRSDKTRKACASAVRALLGNHLAFTKATSSGTLPMVYLSKTCDLPRKTLDRHRKYILAAAVILAHDYPCLSQYVGYISGGQGQ